MVTAYFLILSIMIKLEFDIGPMKIFPVGRAYIVRWSLAWRCRGVSDLRENSLARRSGGER